MQLKQQLPAFHYQQVLNSKKMSIAVKLCGFTERQSILTAIEVGVEFVGLVFVSSSPRNVSIKKAKELSKLIPSSVKKVAVVANPDFKDLQLIAENFAPNLWQFHGQEAPKFIAEVKKIFPKQGIIKAFAIDENFDFNSINGYQGLIDCLLFDSKNPGSGRNFDWKIFSNSAHLLSKVCQEEFLSKPWFLSGGINIGNIEAAINTTKARFVDISSGIEEEKGKKSSKLIIELMQKIRLIEAAH